MRLCVVRFILYSNCLLFVCAYFRLNKINIAGFKTPSQMDDVDIKSLCRVCLQQPKENDVLDLQLIYDEEEDLTYGQCFTVCTKIILPLDADDGSVLPKNLCKSCGLELQVAYDFKKKVDISERFLQETQQSLKNDAMYTDSTESHIGEQLSLSDDELVSHSLCEEYEYLESVTAKPEDLEEYVEYDQYDVKSNNDCNHIEGADGIENDDQEMSSFTILDCEEKIKCPNAKQKDKRLLHENVSEESTSISWETAVVTVANESHLPLTNAEDDQADLCVKVYESDDNTEDTMPLTTTDESTHVEGTRSRKRYSGKFTCNYCQKVFPNHSRMRQHRLSHETDRPKYPCSLCERIYATKQAMMVHTQTVHTKTASHTCSICGKIYAIRKGLEVHMRYHTGNFPYECDLCDRKFAQISHLKTHKNVKHNSERFACEHPNCGKFFTSSASLRNHEFSHGVMPFECEFCQRGYPAKAKLKVHLRRKHGHEMTLDELERMRKFRVIRSKLNLVKVKHKE